MIAFAIVGTGPRAEAAYIPTGGRNAIEPVSLESSSGSWATEPDETEELDTDKKAEFKWQPADWNRSSSTTTGVPQTSGGSDLPSGGMIPVPELPPPARVHYLRLATERLELTAYVESLLDPPRMI